MSDLILITGGTGGLGSTVTSLVLSQGYHVVVPYKTAREAENLRASLPTGESERLTLLEADLIQEEGLRELFGLVDRLQIPLYGLVHLLGGINPFRKTSETTVEDWDFILSLNLRSYFLCAREAMKRFEAIGKGRILGIASMAAIKPSATQSAYAVAKSGVVTLTKVLADEGRAFGVTANCIAPGIIRTNANMEWGESREIGQWVTPEEIGRTILHFLSPASRSINGSVVQMFGGLNV